MPESPETETRSAAPPHGSPDARTLLSCFLRTYLVGSVFNTRGMQNVGFILAMEPGLRVIHPDPMRRKIARKRWLFHYNTHMFFTPLLTGVFLSLEDKIAKGLFPAQVLDGVKNTTIYTLSAIGDSLFTGALLVSWSLTAACLVASELYWAAALWAILWFVFLQAFKAATFVLGWREGLKFLTRLKKWDLINWGVRLKIVNAALLALFLFLIWPVHLAGWMFGPAAFGMVLAAITLSRLGFSREIVAFALFGLYILLPRLGS